MSTATLVPETWELTGDDARETLLHTGRRRLVRDAYQRLREADGFSHARSIALMISLVLLQGIIALVGFAAVLGNQSLADVVSTIVESAMPGPAGEALTTTVRQAESVGASGQYAGLVFGLAGALIAGTTLMGQMERALNRLYGIEKDRPTLEKYRLAFLLAMSAGAAAVAAFVLIAFGTSVGETIESGTVQAIWDVTRWPLAVGLMIAAVAMLFRRAPRRHQPGWTWLAYGATISVVGWALVTAALALFFDWSSSFGDTYGPLAGTIALLLWATCSAVTILFGAAVAAQLEAVRARQGNPTEELAEEALSRLHMVPS